MNENKFIQCVEDLKESKLNYENQKRRFKKEVIFFMRDKGFPVEVTFLGKAFGINIYYSEYISCYIDYKDFSYNIPLDILTKFCDYFGCEFKYTDRGGTRYIFCFHDLNMGY